MDNVQITVRLDAHKVKLSIPRGNEQKCRDAAVLVNHRYQYYKRNYPSASSEQLWMYTAMDIAAQK